MGLGSVHDFELRKIGGPATLAAYVRYENVGPYSDFYPIVSLNAPRSRFKQENATDLLGIVDNGMPVAELLGGRVEPEASETEFTEHSRFAL